MFADYFGNLRTSAKSADKLDVIGNKDFTSSPQATLAMTNTQIVQTCCQFHETI